MAPSSKPPRLYFAYGSNLSLTQMSSRCPTSTYHSLGLLRNYRWIIGERGYANVIATEHFPAASTAAGKDDEAAGMRQRGEGFSLGTKEVVQAEEEAVVGMLYTLEEEDEWALDLAEGVPFAYTKHLLDVEIVRREASANGEKEVVGAVMDGDERREGSGNEGREVVKALVYVDERRLGVGGCKEEYVGRMNRGIRDAVSKGMSRRYVERVIRPFVREEEVGDGDGKIGDPFHPSVVAAGGEYE